METIQQQETKAILQMAERIKELEDKLDRAKQEIRELNELLKHKWWKGEKMLDAKKIEKIEKRLEDIARTAEHGGSHLPVVPQQIRLIAKELKEMREEEWT